MKIFANKNIWKKLVIIFILFSSITFFIPEPVQASVGGTLMEPICSSLIGIGDGIVNVLHKFIIKQEVSLIRVSDGSSWNWMKVAIITIAVIVMAVSIISGLAALEGATYLLAAKTLGVLVVKSASTVAIAAVLFFAADGFSDEIPLPMYTITPEKIIKNEIPLFDVNFINPTKKTLTYDNSVSGRNEVSSCNSDDSTLPSDNINKWLKNTIGIDYGTFITGATKKTSTRSLIEYNTYTKEYNGKKYDLEYYKIKGDDNDSNFYSFTLYERVSGEDVGEIHAISYELQETISMWYNILRMMSIVGMMSVLVYIGIRIIISSTSSQKAKYKQMLGDWLMGMILLFTMHYIMNFSNIAVEKLSSILSSINPTQNIALIPDVVNEKEGMIKQTLDEIKLPDQTDDKVLYVYHEDDVTGTGKKYVEWHTDLMGLIRIKAYEYKDTNDDAYIGFTIMFVVMIIYTVMFAWTYIKRVIYIAFLTLIAPLVALTYPIDKANDGKAQGFDYWFKEYIFNLLLQPLHLLIYTVLISSAIELCEKNWIYALVATGFIISAEKIVRTMFNFSKASTPGAFAGPAGAALTISGMKWLFGHGPKGSNSNGDKSSRDSGENSNNIGSDGSSFGKVKGIPTGFLNNSILSSNNELDNEKGNINNTNDDYNNNNNNNNNTRRPNLDIAKREANERSINKRKGISLAFSNAANRYFGGQQEKWKRKAKNFKPIRTLGGAALGVTAGTIGLASGVASGDFSKAAQYMGIGMAGGYKLGTGIMDSSIDSVTVEGTFDEFQRGLLGEDEFKAKKQNEEISKKARAEATINAIRKYYGGSRSEAIAKAEELLTDYSNFKIDNINEIMNMEEFRDNYILKDNNGNSRKFERKEMAKLNEWNKRYGIAGKNGEELNKVYDQMVKSEKGITREQAIKFTDWTKAYTNSLRN